MPLSRNSNQCCIIDYGSDRWEHIHLRNADTSKKKPIGMQLMPRRSQQHNTWSGQGSYVINPLMVKISMHDQYVNRLGLKSIPGIKTFTNIASMKVITYKYVI
jgi:hypothetical protein